MRCIFVFSFIGVVDTYSFCTALDIFIYNSYNLFISFLLQIFIFLLVEVLPIFFSLQNSTLQCLAEITRSRVIGGPVYGPVASLLPDSDSQDSLEVCACILIFIAFTPCIIPILKNFHHINRRVLGMQLRRVAQIVIVSTIPVTAE